ncbi:MAG: GNAT family N-acetyltransferase [Pseudomonadota bacterium]
MIAKAPQIHTEPTNNGSKPTGGPVEQPRVLYTDRLVLRPFALGDLDAYCDYYCGPRTAGVGGPKPRHIVVERFMAMSGQWALRGFGRYAIDLNGTGIGHVGIMQMDDTDPLELTWTLWDAARQGNGYASEAARAVLAAWTGPPLVAFIQPDNSASIRVAERLGFVEDTKAVAPGWMADSRAFRAQKDGT